MELEPQWYPNLVYFKDINNPETVAGARARDLERDFGPDIKLKSITLEMTKEPVTKGVVDQYLPWLEERIQLKQVPKESRLIGQMGAAMFKTRK